MKKGFTLLELLIVIGILAILATATVLVLNPAEYLRQARDTQRVTDLESLKGALSLFVTSGSSSLGACPTSGRCTYTGFNTFSGGACSGGNVSTVQTTDGLGWVDVNFSALPGGSPLPKLPIDPVNNSTSSAYGYACNTSTLLFELNGFFESTKYKTTDDFDGKDGGSNAGAYEVGTSLSL